MSGTSAQDRDTQLLSIGQPCSHPSCLLVDFLPFKCQHCAEPFCGEHFSVAAHKCSKYDESKYNRVAPSCPLCNVPVAIRPGQDPNVRMEQHITSECSVMTGKSGKSKSTPICAKPKCKKILFAPIRCDKCTEQFCPQHRFPTDHACAASIRISASKTSSGSTQLSNINSKASGASTATIAAIRNTVAAASSPSPGSAPANPSTTPKTTGTHANPFSKSDRSSSTAFPFTIDNNAPLTPTNKLKPVIDFFRAKAERESRRKGMQERAKRGLLSEEEKAMLAAEEAENSKAGKRGDCVVM